MKEEDVIQIVRDWVETFVVALNLCPFAKRELINNKIRFVATETNSEEKLLQILRAELELLNSNKSIETTLLIHPNVLQVFYAYNQFLDCSDGLLVEMGYEGVYQIASFHPEYQFADTKPDDAENYTNRSPYPMLHLLREESLENAIANYPDFDQIPIRNIELMNSLGRDELMAMMKTQYK